MKQDLVWLTVLGFCLWLGKASLLAAERTNTLPNEPVYQGHPLSYWLDGLGKWDQRASEATDAVKSIGSKAMPFILHYTSLRSDGSTNEFDTTRTVARACRLLDQGKANSAVARMLEKGLKDSDPQVRINAIGGLPTAPRFIPVLEKLCHDPNPQVQRAATNALTHLRRYNDWLQQQKAPQPKTPKVETKHGK
jgi:hypothetical protein